MIVPLGYQLPGVSEAVMHDRFVCIVDPENPRLVDGRLTLRDLAEMPHAACAIGKSHTPAERQLETLGITPKVQVSTPGFSVLPFLVSGTDLVAMVPERLARRYEGFARCAVVPAPFPDVPLVEAMYWHHNRHADPAHRWLRDTVRRVGAALGEEVQDEGALDQEALDQEALGDGAPAEIADVDATHPESAFPELSAAS
jgi:DNA-binding transcriptional LysR family regulator